MILYDNTGVTVELRELVNSGVNIWDFEYPIPAQTVSYNGKTAKVPFNKEAFQQKIINHYYFRQIGQETVGRWLHYFRTRIKEIMPYYVQLYEFEAKWFNIDDPLESYNLTETFEQQSEGSGKVNGTTADSGKTEGTNSNTRIGAEDSTRTGNTSGTRKFSNTPQGTIENLDNYLTEATVESGNSSENTVTDTQVSDSGTSTVTNTASGTSETTSTDSGSLTHTLTRRGNIGVQPLGSEVQNIRDAFINIDMMVINELKDLFLQVY